MKRIVLFFLIAITTSCTVAQDKSNFSEKALADVMMDVEGNKITFSEILEQYKGKKVVIDIWASWCGDCIGGMSSVKDLQVTYSDAVFLFLSLDKDFSSWQEGVQKHQIYGEHYYVPKGWKSDFNTAIDLDWIPRYIVVGANGEIELFKAIKASDVNIQKAINS